MLVLLLAVLLDVQVVLVGSHADGPPTAEQPDLALSLIVTDPTGLPIEGASVRVEGPRKATFTRPTARDGRVEFRDVPRGAWAVEVVAPGFAVWNGTCRVAPQPVRECRVELELAKVEEAVDVPAAQSPSRVSDLVLGTVLTARDIAALPDDPEEFERVLRALGGPGARILVNGFEGGHLPPKQMIDQIIIRGDPYSAENHSYGGTGILVLTKAGSGPGRIQAGLGLGPGRLTAAPALGGTQAPASNVTSSVRGERPLVPGRSDVSYKAVVTSSSKAVPVVADSRVESRSSPSLLQADREFDLDVQWHQQVGSADTLYSAVSIAARSSTGLGVGGLELASHAYSTHEHQVLGQIFERGVIRGAWLRETRVTLGYHVSGEEATSDAQTIVVNGVFTGGGAQRNTRARSLTTEVSQALTGRVGRSHTLRVGASVSGGWSLYDDRSNENGTYTFGGWNDYEAGRPSLFTLRTPVDGVESRQWQGTLFVHDDLRLSKSTWLYLGARYEQQSHVTGGAVSPRFGLAWSPFTDGRGVVRVGAGMFRDWYPEELYASTLLMDGNRGREIVLADPPLHRAVDMADGPGLVRTMRASDSLSLPIRYRTSISGEYGIGRHVRLQCVLFLNVGRNEFRAVAARQAVNTTLELSSTGRSRRTGLTAGVTVNALPKSFLSVNYSLGWSRDDGASGWYPLGVAAGRTVDDWAPGRDDTRHRIYATALVPLGMGLRATADVRYESAPPYDARSGIDRNGDGFLNDRPTGFDRNTIRGTSTANVDAVLSWSPDNLTRRDHTRKGSFSVYLRVSNVPNLPNYNRWNDSVDSGQFGRPISAGTPRRVEFGAKWWR
jgi:hypothetical protein